MRQIVDPVNHTDDRELFERLHEVVHRFRHVQQQVLAEDEAGLSVMEARALGFLAHHPQATPSDLAKRAGRDKAQITRLLNQLSERGLLAREAGKDRRSHTLRLTEAGTLVHRRLERKRLRAASAWFAPLSPAQRAQLHALLALLGDVEPAREPAHAGE